ncbi:MAG: hypothetical protein ACFFDT_08010 [Candidatus Hodarchaeota archaeon]
MKHQKIFTVRLEGETLEIFRKRKEELKDQFPKISDNAVVANIILSLKKAEMEV